ncbi:hypothetical protein H0H92_001544 [Tricholoma furcatifolium]|nr:hypothetical protein H0H92_001544 [Tricholoma furcatifolium]
MQHDVAPLSLGQQATSSNTSSFFGRFSKLGKFLGLRTGSTSNARPQQYSKYLPSTPTSPSHNVLSTIISSEKHPVDCADSERTYVFDCPNHRVLNHSTSVPTMRGDPFLPSEASTRCPSPVQSGEDTKPTRPTLKVHLRAHTVPATLNEKTNDPVSVSEGKPVPEWRWSWKRFKRDKSRSASSLFRPTTSPAPSSKATPWEYATEPFPPLSTVYSAEAQPSRLSRVMSNESVMSDDLDSVPTPRTSRRKSMFKLARTLGASPQDFESVVNSDGSFDGESVGTSRREYFRSRTQSLMVSTSFSSPHLSHISRLPTIQSRSKTSLSTNNTDDLHHLNLADDPSSNWGEVWSGSRTSFHSSSSPISPIVFSPPTPITAQPPRQPLVEIQNSDVKLQEVTRTSLSMTSSPLQATTLNRSRSMTFTPFRSKKGRLAQLAGADGAGPRPHTGDNASSLLPVKAGWLQGPSTLQEETSRTRSFVESHPEYADDCRNWSGQWNQDSVHDVIKRLRTLK